MSIIKETVSEICKVLHDMTKIQDTKFANSSMKGRYPPAQISLMVLGNGGKNSPTCLCVTSDQSNYFFNCGEGTQRLAGEYKVKLSIMGGVFITHKSWKNIGGLLGMTLNSVEGGSNTMIVQGPPCSADILKNTRGFGDKVNMKLRELKVGRTYSDSILSINSYPIYGPMSELSNRKHQEPEPKRRHIENGIERREMSVVYVGKLASKKGTLNLEKCLNRGLTAGPSLKLIKDGNSITLPSGDVIQPHEVCDPDLPEKTFIVVECPSEEYIDSLLNCEELKVNQKEQEMTAEVIVHFSPVTVMRNARYQEWMDCFSDETTHIYVNESNKTAGSTEVHRISQQLHLLNSSIFPLLKEEGPTSRTPSGTYYDIETSLHIPSLPVAQNVE